MLKLTLAKGRWLNFYIETPHGPKRIGRFRRIKSGGLCEFDFDREVKLLREETDDQDWSDWEERKK